MANIDLATYVAKVAIDTTGLNKGLKEADSSIKGGLGDLVNWSGLKLKGVQAAMGTAIAKFGKESVKSFASVESEMNKVFTMLPSMSGEAQQKMTMQARDLALEVGKLPEEVIPAIYSALSAGVPADNVFDFVEVASKGAVAGGAETEQMVEGLASVINAYGMEASDAEKVSDVFFMTLKNGMTSIPELSHSLSQVTPIASAMGVEFEEVAGAMATMTAQGIPTSTAANQIKAMLAELGKEGSKSSDIFREISGQTFPEFMESGGELADVLAIMEEHAVENDIAMIDMFGSIQAGQGFLALTGENAQSFIEDIDAMRESAGSTDEAFEKMDSGIARMGERLEVLINDIMVSIGEILSPFLAAFMAALIAGLELIQPPIRFIAELVGQVVEAVMERIEKIKERMDKFAEENSEVLESIATTIQNITDKIRTLVEAVLDVIGKIIDNFHEGIQSGTDSVWTAILDIIDAALKVGEAIIDAFIALVQGDWSAFGDALGKITDTMWNFVKTLFNSALQAVIGIVRGAVGGLKSAASMLFNAVLNAARQIMGQLVNWLPQPIQNIIRAFTSKFGEARSAGRGMFESVWEGMKGIWGSISNWVSDKVSWLTNKLAFWRRGQNEMKSGGGAGSGRAGGTSRSAGSFATGSRLIKKDGYNLLHKGEMVVPADLNPFNPRRIKKGGFYNDKFALAGAGGGGNAVYSVALNIDKVESGVDIEKAVEKGIKKAEDKRGRKLSRRGV